jgi:hypothetical protein
VVVTKREAKRWVCDRLGATLEANTSFYDGLFYLDETGEEFPARDCRLIEDACQELAQEFRRRGGNRDR